MFLFSVTEKSELEIEAIKVKGQFKEAFLRFPHIAEQIFEFLDVQSLSKCQEVSKYWQKFILETKPFSRQLENYTSIQKSMLKKSLKDYDFQTIQSLAYCASFSHKKAVEACIPFQKLTPFEPKGPTLFYYLLSEENHNETQFLLAKLILLNKMNKSTAMSTSLDNQEADCFRLAVSKLLKLMDDSRSGKFGEAYTIYKDMVTIQQGNMHFWSWIAILHAAVGRNHLAICKLIFEQIQDIEPLHKWGKIVLQYAISFGHIDIVKFFVDEIQGIDLFAERNPFGENLLDMAKRLGHKDICTFFCGHKSTLKILKRWRELLDV